MENRLASLEQQRALQVAADHSQKEEWEERLRISQQGEESVRRELQNLRSASCNISEQLQENLLTVHGEASLLSEVNLEEVVLEWKSLGLFSHINVLHKLNGVTVMIFTK